MAKVFFINVMPVNDRREKVDEQLLFTETVEQSPADFRYTLVTVGDSRPDPWVVAQAGMQGHPAFCPLIAVNPFYQHPVSVAKRLVTLQSFYSRPFGLNLVSGSFFHEMQRLGDSLNDRERNLRLKEFSEALDTLLNSTTGATYQGNYYSFRDVQLFPKTSWRPDLFLSGSLPPEARPKRENLYFMKNRRPWEDLPPAEGPRQGLGFGLCARPDRAAARRALQELFPADRKGQMLAAMANANAETPWNRALRNQAAFDESGLYSLLPVRNFWSSAPYLVGSYEEVAAEIQNFIAAGYEFFLTDFHPRDREHVRACLRLLPAK